MRDRELEREIHERTMRLEELKCKIEKEEKQRTEQRAHEEKLRAHELELKKLELSMTSPLVVSSLPSFKPEQAINFCQNLTSKMLKNI